MSDIIQLLPDSVANQIAAGEVIQRPASVIKELVENAVDAGATEIHVIVVDAGRTSIQVIDNGKGMSETDARLSFERHATSKISNAADLFALHTMGFRGEALASIAAVAQVELKTRQESCEIGTHLSIAASKVTGQEPCSCPVGCNFLVENLFYNVPARRKFLKANSTELKNIITAFERIALVYPGVSFTLHSNSTEIFSLRAGGLRQRIVDVLGKRINQFLLPVSVDTSLCKISGFVGKPESARKKGANQYFFVNGRFMKHPYFNKAVMSAYDRLIPEGEQVPYFIYFEVSPENIDVNIHPTKTEIKFENEQAIWQILMATVKETIGIFNDVATIDFDTQGRPEIPVFGPEDDIQAPKVQYNPHFNPFGSTTSSAAPKPADTYKREPVGEWGQLYDGLRKSGSTATPPFVPDDDAQAVAASGSDDLITMSLPPRTSDASGGVATGQSVSMAQDTDAHDGTVIESKALGGGLLSAGHSDTLFYSDALGGGTPSDVDAKANGADSVIAEKSPSHYQYKGKYIMTAVKSGLMIIDQHRAHIRILYEQYLDRLSRKKCESQKVLFPEAVHLGASDGMTLERIMPEMQAMGFELTSLGGGSYAVNAVPAGLEGISIPGLIQDMVSSASEQPSAVIADINKALALSMARHAAITYGCVLDNTEMEFIVNGLFACSNFNYTPDGKAVLCILKQTEIEHLLG